MAFLKQFKLFLHPMNYPRFEPAIKYNKLFSSGAVLTSNGMIFECLIYVFTDTIQHFKYEIQHLGYNILYLPI